MAPTIGRTVHYVLDEGPSRGEHRPAVVVRVWQDSLVQLQVLTDSDPAGSYNDRLPCPLWRTSVKEDPTGTTAGTWHWPEREV